MYRYTYPYFGYLWRSAVPVFLLDLAKCGVTSRQTGVTSRWMEGARDGDEEWALFVPFLGIPSAETNGFYIDRRVSRRRIHRCKNHSSPPRESRGKEGKQITNIRTISLLSSGFPWRRRMIFTSMDPPPRDASIDVKTIRLRRGNPEEWDKESPFLITITCALHPA